MKKFITVPVKTKKVVEEVTEARQEITDADGSYEYLLGKEVVVITSGYIYTGTCSGVNDLFIELSDPSIIYETGPWTNEKWKDAQRLPTDLCRVERAQMECPFELKRIVLK